MIHFLIVDDEPLSRLYIKDLIGEFCTAACEISEAANATQAREIIARSFVDVVYLDIEMPAENGFEWLESIRECNRNDFQLVFITGYDHYAVRAIKEQPSDYLLKPVDRLEFAQTLQRLEKKILGGAGKENPKEDYLEQKMAVHFQGGFRLITLKDILVLEADDNYTSIRLITGEQLVVSKSLKEFERKLDPDWFFRVHKSHIINMYYFSEFISQDGGYVKLDNGMKIHVSRYRLPELLASVQRFTNGLKT